MPDIRIAGLFSIVDSSTTQADVASALALVDSSNYQVNVAGLLSIVDASVYQVDVASIIAIIDAYRAIRVGSICVIVDAYVPPDTPGKRVARQAALGIDDANGACQSLSKNLRHIDMTISVAKPDATGFTNTHHIYLPDGVKDCKLVFDTYVMSRADALVIDELFYSILGASTRFVFGPTGSDVGNLRYSASALLSQYKMTYLPDDVARCSGELVIRSGSVTRDYFSS